MSVGKLFSGTGTVFFHFAEDPIDLFLFHQNYFPGSDVVDRSLNNMGAVYTEGHWGEHKPEMFRAAVKNTDSVVQSRSSNS